MTYATKPDLLDRFGATELIQLTDEFAQGVIDDVRLTRALTDADGEINGYLSVRYSLPLATVPPVVTRLACDIARYLLFKNEVPEDIKKRYDDAIRMLKLIWMPGCACSR